MCALNSNTLEIAYLYSARSIGHIVECGFVNLNRGISKHLIDLCKMISSSLLLLFNAKYWLAKSLVSPPS